MNGLQVALAVIGVVAVIAILIYNRLQERKYRRQTEAGFVRPNRDALLDENAGRAQVDRVWSEPSEPIFNEADTALDAATHSREPIFQDDDILHAEAGIPAPESDVPVSIAQQVAQSPEPSAKIVATHAADTQPTETTVRETPHNELIEFRAQMRNVDGIPSEVFTEIFNRCRSMNKPVRWRALPLGGLEWEVPQPQSCKRYLEVVACMQLADRNGAASRDELTALCNLVQEVALSNGWQSKCDDLVESMARALSLDKFCADVDVLIGLNIIARGNALLQTAKICHEAEAAGMQKQADGTYHLLDSRNETLFSLTARDGLAFSAGNGTETKAITLLFDVPRVPDGLKTFDSMVALGRKLGHESGGLLVDDNMRPLTDAGIEKIRARLVQIYDKMESRGISPGGRLALRLFA